MLRITPPSNKETFEAHRSGPGFAWWYVDLVDGDGNGLVLIWAYQLPFLAHLEEPTNRGVTTPSLSLGLYRGNREVFYLLQQYGSGAAAWDVADDGQSWSWGSTCIALDTSRERWELAVDLDAEVPGEPAPVRGRIELRGFPRTGGDGEFGSSDHIWSPMLLGASASGTVTLGEETLWRSLDARGYFDRNASRGSLEQIGIRRWQWMRIAFPNQELALYDVQASGGERHSLSFCVNSKGAALASASARPHFGMPRRSLWGPRWFGNVRFTSPEGVEARVMARHLVESGPFYLRYLVEAENARGQRGVGVAEVVDVRRLAHRWHRPLVRMRRHVRNGRNSIWLPLFIGTRRGRWVRLLRYWMMRLFPTKQLEPGGP